MNDSSLRQASLSETNRSPEHKVSDTLRVFVSKLPIFRKILCVRFFLFEQTHESAQAFLRKCSRSSVALSAPYWSLCNSKCRHFAFYRHLRSLGTEDYIIDLGSKTSSARKMLMELPRPCSTQTTLSHELSWPSSLSKRSMVILYPILRMHCWSCESFFLATFLLMHGTSTTWKSQRIGHRSRVCWRNILDK